MKIEKSEKSLPEIKLDMGSLDIIGKLFNHNGSLPILTFIDSEHNSVSIAIRKYQNGKCYIDRISVTDSKERFSVKLNEE